MSLAFLALSVLVVGACDWPPQDYAAPAAPIMLMDCSAEEQSAAQAQAEGLIGERSSHLDLSDHNGSLLSLGNSRVAMGALSTLPPTIAGLTNLWELNISGTHVSDLEPIVGLVRLNKLNLYNTPVADLTPIATREHLEMLNLSNTKVSDLSATCHRCRTCFR